MKQCPITYELIADNESYSKRGLYLLSPQLKNLHALDFNAAELRKEALNRAGKMSIQGVQTKLSAQLRVKEERLEIVNCNGHYILKTQNEYYKQLPENEALSMSLAKLIGLEVPVHGLVYAKDGSMVYFIKRFDRKGHKDKLAVEDFSQLSGRDRFTKYDSSMEKVAQIVAQFCTFPKVEFVKLLKLTLFNFLIGNEDMHLKNFSLITRENKITLSPVYDLLNSSIVSAAKEELALPLNGRKNNLRAKDFLEYFALERLGLNQVVVNQVLNDIRKAIPLWEDLIKKSFLSQEMQMAYIELLKARAQILL